MDVNEILKKDENGNYILSEEERIEQLLKIENYSNVCKIAFTLSDEKKIDDRVLKKLASDNYYLRELLLTVDDIECVIKGLNYLSDGNKVRIINQDKFDSKTRLSLMEYVDEDNNKMAIANTIKDDTLLEESLKYFNSEYYKRDVIILISDIDTKIRLTKTLTKTDYRYNIISKLDLSVQIKYMDELEIIPSDKLKILLSKDENGNYILTEEERFELSASIPTENSIYNLALTLSDKYRVDDRILKKIPNNSYNLRDLLKKINDIECVKKGLKYLSDGYRVSIINQDKFDSKTRLSLMEYVDEDNNKMAIANTIKDDTLLEESLKYFNSEYYKRDVIILISDIDTKIRLAKTLTDKDKKYEIISKLDLSVQIKYMDELEITDSNKLKIILSKDESGNYILTEEERFELSASITNDNCIYDLALTLSDKYRVDDRILKKIPNNSYNLRDLLKKINDIECVKKGLSYLSDGYRVSIINQDKFDSKTRLSLIEYVDDELIRFDVVKTITDDDLLEESLKYFNSEYYKRDVIKLISDIDKKIRLAKTLTDKDKKYEIISKLDLSVQIKYMDELEITDSNKLKIILSKDASSNYILTEEERLELSESITNVACIYNLALTLSDKYRVDDRILKKLSDNTYDLKDLLKTINDIECVKKGIVYLGDSSKVDIIKQYKYDSKARLDLVKYVNEQSWIFEVVKTITEDDLLEEALKFFTSNNYKSETVKKIKNKERRIILIEDIIEDTIHMYNITSIIERFLSSDKEELYLYLNSIVDKEKSLIELTDPDIFNEEFSKLKGIGSKYRLLINNSKNITDESRLLFLSTFTDENDRLSIIKRIVLDENKIKAYNQNPLVVEKNKMAFIRLLKDETKQDLLYILDNNIDKLIIVNEIKDITLKQLTLEKIDNYQEIFRELFSEGKFKLISKFNDEILISIFDSKQVKILHEYNRFSKESIREHFARYIHEYYDTLEEKDIDNIATLIFNVDTSNSEEIYKQSDSFVNVLLSSDDPLRDFYKTENIFLKNHLPMFAKAYLTFLTVHPDFKSYRFSNMNNGTHSVSSPVLNNISLLHKKTLILTDLIKCSLGSNSANFLQYLSNLELWNSFYINNKNRDYESLSEEEKNILKEFRDSILTLYDNYLRKENIEATSDILGDLNKISDILCKNNSDKSLADLVIGGYCHFIGINTIEDAKRYVYQEVTRANTRNISRYEDNDFKIVQGDFVKGFNINYFNDMANNGVIAHDYLGGDMSTDMTALDTDLSRIYKDTTGMSIKEIIDLKDKDSGFFGQGYIVVKDNHDRISLTKKSSNEEYSRVDIVEKKEMFSHKIEAFSNGTGSNISNPYGIRTGFSLSDIDFIVFDEEGGKYRENIYKIIIPLVKSGIYIPIVSKQTSKVLFSYEEYNELMDKMSGLKRYHEFDYNLSEYLDCDVYRKIALSIDDSNDYINYIKGEILNTFVEGLGSEFNVITHINGKLNKREVQVLDSGSTSRATNIPYDGDYDFIIRIDRDIDINPELKKEFIKNIISKFDVVTPGKDVDGDIKEMLVRINDKEYKLDLSFVRKTDKVSYSTEMCVFDRLDTVRNLYPDKYKLVLANIIYAKMYLKKYECYSKGQYKQGGLGGIGVENWILQNGGSFYEAALDFVSHAYKDGEIIPFIEFVKIYRVWDFGENFYTDRKNLKDSKTDSLHDNFVSKNLTNQGYEKMCKALKKFVDDYKLNQVIDLSDNINLEEISSSIIKK